MARNFALSVAVLAGVVGLFGTGTSFAQAPQPAPKRLQLAFSADGTVTLDAQNVTVREILFEWARQCGCLVVNGDRLSGTPITVPLQFKSESQKVVLDSLLRTAPGYVLTPRRAVTGVSNYDMIYIVAATSTPVAAPYSSSTASVVPSPALPTPGSPDDEIPPVQPPGTPGGTQVPGTAANAPQRPTTSTPAFIPVPIVPIGGSASSSSAPQPGTMPAPGQPTSAPAPGQPTSAPPIPGQPMPVPVPAPAQPIIR
jgi:hypothetical protein